MNEKRRHPRVQPRLNERIEIQIIGDGFIEILDARDISIGGLGIWVPSRFEGCNIDKEVEIVLRLPDHNPFVCHGIIKYFSKDKMTEFFGIMFTQIHDQHRALIQAYVDKRMSAFDIPK
jgi:hypothetical protein